MPEALSLGPFVIPTLRVGTLLVLVMATWFTTRVAERRDLAVGWTAATCEWALWFGLAGARLGFAVQNWQAYLDAPWTALYIWQPGYSLATGFVLSAGYALWRIWWRAREERPAYLRVLGGGFGIALLATIGLTLSPQLDFGSEALRVGDQVPNFRLLDLSGQPVAFSDLEGKVVVLNFWATWCPPCRREMPMLDAMNRAYADKGAVIVGVDVGESAEVARRYAEQVGVRYPIWVGGRSGEGYDSTEALHRQFGGVGLPTTIFIDPDGVIRSFQVGELSAGVVQREIEAMLR